MPVRVIPMDIVLERSWQQYSLQAVSNRQVWGGWMGPLVLGGQLHRNTVLRWQQCRKRALAHKRPQTVVCNVGIFAPAPPTVLLRQPTRVVEWFPQKQTTSRH